MLIKFGLPQAVVLEVSSQRPDAFYGESESADSLVCLHLVPRYRLAGNGDFLFVQRNVWFSMSRLRNDAGRIEPCTRGMDAGVFLSSARISPAGGDNLCGVLATLRKKGMA